MVHEKDRNYNNDFHVFNQFFQIRRDVTDLIMREFGFSREKFDKILRHRFGGKTRDQLESDQQHRYDIEKRRLENLYKWLMDEERHNLFNIMSEIGGYLYTANSIYPQYLSELSERRKFQEYAMGYLNKLDQELSFIAETIPVDINIYTPRSKAIHGEIKMIGEWRKADNKRFKKTIINDVKRDDVS